MKFKKFSAAALSVIILSSALHNADISVSAADFEQNLSDCGSTCDILSDEVKSGMDDTVESVAENVKIDLSKASEIPMTLSDDEMRIYSGYLTEDEEIAYIVESLQPGEILNASLICPLTPSLDYDLLLCECDIDTFEVGETLDFSTLDTHFDTYLSGINKTADESISYVNNSNEVKYYYIIVFSKQGYSTLYNFNLTVSVSEKGSYDNEEPNDSVYHPSTISNNIARNLNLHSENDNDWFEYTAVEDIPSIEIDTGVIDYELDVYLTNGRSLYLVYPNKYGVYDLTAGYTYFIHVYSVMSDFTSNSYNLKVTPNNMEVDKIELINFTGDMDSDKAEYHLGALYRFKKEFTITVKVQTKNGYGIPNQDVYLLWNSGSWTEESGNSYKGTKATTDDDGIAIITLSSLPAGVGSYSHSLGGPVYFMHYYDVDKIILNAGDRYKTMNVYHFAYSAYV